MKNLEFVEKHGYFYNHKDKEYKIFTPYDYQINLLSEFENNRFVAVNSARQMGITQILSFHLANWIINNKTDMNTFYFMTHNWQASTELLDLIRISVEGHIKTTDNSLYYIVNNRKELSLSNGMTIKAINSIRGINLAPDNRKVNPYGLVVDGASYIDSEMEGIGRFLTDTNQIILVSGFKNEYNFFYDELFVKENIFKKITINWELNPNYTQEWYNNTKKIHIGHMYEYDLIRTSEPTDKKSNKNRVINIRLDDETLNKISNKLIELDLSLSDYIRHLIKKDN